VGGIDATERNDNPATQIAMFYFQQLFNAAMTGIDSGGATAGVVQIAQYILLASLLFGIYEAWARGGDTHFLGATAVRFFAVGLVMVSYGPAFRDVNGMFNNVANFINTSTAGGGDVFGQWMSDLSNYWNNNNGIQALWGMITGAFSGLLESLLLLVGYILFPITYALFSLFYALYGSIQINWPVPSPNKFGPHLRCSSAELCPAPVGENHIGALFRNHHYRSMRVTGHDCRHDGTVDNSEP
jgi:hypothetical protein